MTIMQTCLRSSNVRAFGFDEETQTLIVAFHGSGTYTYDGVPPEIAAELTRINQAGESVGKYFQAEIKNKYPATKVPPAPEREPVNILGAG